MKFLIYMTLFILSVYSRPINCRSTNMVLSVLDTPTVDCNDVDLCKIICHHREPNFLQINLDDPSIPFETRDAYLSTCTWELERKEILTNMKLPEAQGRGQIISQYIAKISRPFVRRLPFSKNPPLDTHIIYSRAGGAHHRDMVSRFKSKNTSKREIWVPTVKTMRDWIDYMIYVSNHYTFFKDLCKKNSLSKAQYQLRVKLLSDASKGLYPRYRKDLVPRIKKFIEETLDKILSKFREVYKNPQNTCSCLDVVKKIKDPKEKNRLKNIIYEVCENGRIEEYKRHIRYFKEDPFE